MQDGCNAFEPLTKLNQAVSCRPHRNPQLELIVSPQPRGLGRLTVKKRSTQCEEIFSAPLPESRHPSGHRFSTLRAITGPDLAASFRKLTGVAAIRSLPVVSNDDLAVWP